MKDQEQNEIMGDAIEETQDKAAHEPEQASKKLEQKTRLEETAKTAPMADDMQQRQGEPVSQWRARLDAMAKAKK